MTLASGAGAPVGCHTRPGLFVCSAVELTSGVDSYGSMHASYAPPPLTCTDVARVPPDYLACGPNV
jgi:hypothetical protein